MAATLLGSLLVSLGLESGEFKSGLSDAEKQLRAASKRFGSSAAAKTGKRAADLEGARAVLSVVTSR